MIKKILVVLSVLFCFTATAMAADADNLVNQGQDACRQGDYQKAVFFFNKAILLEPERGDIFLQSAKAWVELGDYQQAINDLDECIRLSPNELESYCVRSYLLQLTGEHQKALLDINKLLGDYPANVSLYYVRAFIFEQAGDFDSAIADYTKALKLNKDLPEKGKKDELLLFAELSDLPFFDKKGAALYFGRAMAQSKNGNFSEAKKDFKKAARLNNDIIDELPEGVVASDTKSA